MDYRIETIKTEQYCYLNAYIGNGSERVGKLAVEYFGENKAKIIYVITDLKHVDHGVATALMNKAIKEFETYDLWLNVIPMPRDSENIKHRTVRGLCEFYKKFGFEKTYDPCVPTMIKKASLPILEG